MIHRSHLPISRTYSGLASRPPPSRSPGLFDRNLSSCNVHSGRPPLVSHCRNHMHTLSSPSPSPWRICPCNACSPLRGACFCTPSLCRNERSPIILLLKVVLTFADRPFSLVFILCPAMSHLNPLHLVHKRRILEINPPENGNIISTPISAFNEYVTRNNYGGRERMRRTN